MKLFYWGQLLLQVINCFHAAILTLYDKLITHFENF